MKQLSEYIGEHGPVLELAGRTYTAEGFSSDGDIAVGTLSTPRATYTVLFCPLARVASRPDAEVWSVMSSGRRPRQVVMFAVDEKTLRILH